MLKFINKFRKQILAVFGVFLMITFAGNFGKGTPNRGGGDREVGRVGNRPVTDGDIATARAELDVIKKDLTTLDSDQYYRSVRVPITVRLFGQEGAAKLHDKPELFAVLKTEAMASNIRPDGNDVKRLMDVYSGPVNDPDEMAMAESAAADLLLIRGKYLQWQSAVKLTMPMMDRALSEMAQKPVFNVVQVRADGYLDKVAAPTTQQVQAQFDKYSGTLKGTPVADTNPFGFGYKFPVRTKVQYVRVPQREIEKAVIAAKSDYDWDVAANRYYQANQSKYEEKALVGPALPGAKPTIKPLDKVKAEVLAAVREPMIKELTKQASAFVGSTLDTAWRSSTAAVPTTSPAGSSLDLSAFKSAAAALLANPSLKIIAYAGETEFLTDDQLGKDLTIGSPDVRSYISSHVTADLAAKDPMSPSALSELMRPSPGIETAGDLTFVRAVSVLPSNPPPNVESVRTQVESDLKAEAAYALARADAEKLSASAKDDLLPGTAAAQHRVVLSVGPVSRYSRAGLDVITPPLADSVGPFLDQAFKTVGQVDLKANPHPSTVIGLPPDGRLFVVQVTSVVPEWPADEYYKRSIGFRRDLLTYADADWQKKYFDSTAAYTRAGFTPTKGSAKQ